MAELAEERRVVEVHRFAGQPIRIELVDAARRDINRTPVGATPAHSQGVLVK